MVGRRRGFFVAFRSLRSSRQDRGARLADAGAVAHAPANTAPPSGYGLSVTGGYVNVSIPKGILNGYGAIWTVVVTSQDVCGAGVYCMSPNATVTIGVQCG